MSTASAREWRLASIARDEQAMLLLWSLSTGHYSIDRLENEFSPAIAVRATLQRLADCACIDPDNRDSIITSDGLELLRQLEGDRNRLRDMVAAYLSLDFPARSLIAATILACLCVPVGVAAFAIGSRELQHRRELEQVASLARAAEKDAAEANRMVVSAEHRAEQLQRDFAHRLWSLRAEARLTSALTNTWSDVRRVLRLGDDDTVARRAELLEAHAEELRGQYQALPHEGEPGELEDVVTALTTDLREFTSIAQGSHKDRDWRLAGAAGNVLLGLATMEVLITGDVRPELVVLTERVPFGSSSHERREIRVQFKGLTFRSDRLADISARISGTLRMRGRDLDRHSLGDFTVANGMITDLVVSSGMKTLPVDGAFVVLGGTLSFVVDLRLPRDIDMSSDAYLFDLYVSDDFDRSARGAFGSRF